MEIKLSDIELKILIDALNTNDHGYDPDNELYLKKKIHDLIKNLGHLLNEYDDPYTEKSITDLIIKLKKI